MTLDIAATYILLLVGVGLVLFVLAGAFRNAGDKRAQRPVSPQQGAGHGIPRPHHLRERDAAQSSEPPA